MFAVVYKFDVVKGKEEQFEKAWRRMTELIMEYRGGLGSRLHKNSIGNYIAYAQWPSEEAWKDKTVKMPDEAESVWQLMDEACVSDTTLFTMNMLDDLLVKEI